MGDEWLAQAAANLTSSMPQQQQPEPWVQQAATLFSREQENRLSSSIRHAVGVNADSYAKTQQAATEINVPWGLAERKPREVESLAAQQRALSKLQDTEYVKQAFHDPEFASLAHDDIDNLGFLEQTISRGIETWKVLERAKGALKAAPSSVSSAAAGIFAEGYNLLSEYVGQPLGRARILPEDPFARGRDFFMEARRNADLMSEQLRGDRTGEGQTEQAIYSGIESYGQMLPGLLGSILTGNPVPMLAWGAMIAGGQAAGEAIEKDVSPAQTLAYSVAQGGIEWATELLPALKLLGDLKVGSSFFRTLMDQAVREVPQEQVATVLQDLNDWSVLNPEKTFQQYIDERPMAAYQTFVATLTGTGAQTTTAYTIANVLGTFAEEQKQAQKAENLNELLKQYSEVARESKLAERAPDKFKDFVKGLLKEDADATFYVNAQEFTEYFQSQNVDPGEVAKDLGLTEEYQQALAEDNEVPIPAVDYLTKLNQFDGLSDITRVTDEGMTPKEAKVWMETQGEAFQAEAEKVLKANEQDTTIQESADKVQTRIAEQIEATGRFDRQTAEKMAMPYRNFAIVYGNKVGMTPEEFADKYKLIVMGGLQAGPEGGMTLEQMEGGKEAQAGKAVAEDAVKETVKEAASETYGQGPMLSALHNLSSENLLFADKMGGFAVPSIGVVREDMGIEGYGDITLIGKKQLGDPKQVEIYDADAYTSTFPTPEYPKVRMPVAQKLVDEIRPYAEKYERSGYVKDATWDYAVNTPNPQKIIDEWMRSNGAKAMFLEGKGIKTRPVMVAKSFEFVWMDDKEFSGKFWDLFHEVDNAAPGDRMDHPKLKDLGDLARKALDRYLAKHPDQVLEREIYGITWGIGGEWIADSNAKMPWNVMDKVASTIRNIGKKEVDESTLRERLDKKLKGKEAEYHAWVTEKVMSMFGEPFLKIGRKRAPYTLDNIVKQMTSKGVQAQEQTMTFGGGMARATAATRFTDVQWMRNVAETGLKQKDELEEDRKKAEALLEEYRMAVLDYNIYGDSVGATWDALDRSMKAIAWYAKNRMKRAPKSVLAEALRKNEFKGVPDHVLELGVAAGNAMLEAPVPYFEAKPKRVVTLNEFVGAAVSDDVSKEVLAVLKKHNIEVIKYGQRYDEAARTQAVVALRNKLAAEGKDVLFQQQRGQIQFPQDITQAPSIITLLENADLSTFLHESSHFFLQVMQSIAAQPDAPQAVVNDLQILHKWFYKENPNWDGIIRTEQHEQFARGFEKYLFENNAPSLELRGVFQTFRAWLLDVYRSLKALKVKLTPEVRGVMDRMLATDQQIQDMEVAKKYEALFETQEKAGMSDTEWQKYQSSGATQDAQSELTKRSLQDMKWQANAKSRVLRELQKDAREKRKAARQEAEEEVYGTPVYAARRYLTHGISPPWMDMEMEPTKLSTKALKELYGEDLGYKSNPNVVDPEFDSLLVAIAKMGGIDTAEAEAQGIDPESWKKGNQPVFGKRVFRKGGESFDGMAEKLHQYGYFEGEYDPNILLDKIVKEQSGVLQYSSGVNYDFLRRQEVQNAPDWRKLGYGKYGMLAEDGATPDEVAISFGFSSGDSLIRSLVNAPHPKDAIEDRTDQIMLQRYGDLTDQKAMERAAESAIHNEARLRHVATELRHLDKQLKARGKTGRVDVKGRPITYNILDSAAKGYAEKKIASRKLKDIKTAPFLAASTRAAKAADAAFRKKKPDEAAQHKRAQLLNMHFFRVADKAVDEIDRGIRFLNKFNRQGTRKNLDIDYLEQIDAILARYELRKLSLKEIKRRQSLAEWVKSQQDQGLNPVIDDKILNDAQKQNYKEMTLEEFRGLRDSVKNIEHLARLKKKLLTQKERREFNELMDHARQSIEDNANRVVTERPTPNDVLGKIGHQLRRFAAEHRKFGSFLREMDGGKDGGWMWRLLGMPAIDAQNKETEMRHEASLHLAGLFEDIHLRTWPGNLRAKKFDIPGVNISLTDEQRIMTAMYWGLEGNRQRLMDGGVIAKRRMSQDEIEAILDTLTKEEWDLVQGVWDYFETFKDEVADQEKRLTGREPKWLDPIEVQTKYGTYRGGYFPAKYDTELSTKSDMLAAATDLRMAMKGAFNSSSTRDSYTQDRAKEVKDRPLLLSFSAITSHVNEVAHRLAWQDWVTDANRIFRALDSDIREYYGPDVLREMTATVEDVASGDSQRSTGWGNLLNYLRVGSTIVGLGLRFTTAAIQPTGYGQSINRIGAEWVGHGMKEYVKNPIKATQFAQEKSALMRDRNRTFQREVNEILNKIRIGSKVPAIEATYFYLIGKMQQTVDVPTWIGAYHKGLAQLNYELAADEDARKSIEHQAARQADQAVKDSQSHGDILDLARVQRGNPFMKLWTNFYSYFSATYQLNVESYRRTKFKDPVSAMKFLGDMVTINILPVIIAVAMRESLKPECGNDLECYAKKLAAEQQDYLFGQMIGLREIGSGVNFWKDYQYDYSGPAGIRFFKETQKAVQQIAQGEMDIAAFKAVNNVMGTILHYPAGQINSTVEGVLAIERGEVEGIGVVQAVLAGPPRK